MRLDKYLPGGEAALAAEAEAERNYENALAEADHPRFAAVDAVKISALPLEPREGWCLSGPLHGKKLAARSDSVHLATEVGGKISVFEYKFVCVEDIGLWVPSEWDDATWASALLKQAFEI